MTYQILFTPADPSNEGQDRKSETKKKNININSLKLYNEYKTQHFTNTKLINQITLKHLIVNVLFTGLLDNINILLIFLVGNFEFRLL